MNSSHIIYSRHLHTPIATGMSIMYIQLASFPRLTRELWEITKIQLHFNERDSDMYKKRKQSSSCATGWHSKHMNEIMLHLHEQMSHCRQWGTSLAFPLRSTKNSQKHEDVVPVVTKVCITVFTFRTYLQTQQQLNCHFTVLLLIRSPSQNGNKFVLFHRHCMHLHALHVHFHCLHWCHCMSTLFHH